MRRAHGLRVLTTVLLLGACERGSQGVAPSDGAQPKAAPAPEADAKAGQPEADAKADAKAGQPEAGQPYRRPGDPASGVDEFVFWGWSDDGHYYAFETFHHGSDMANCEGEAELTIVDAQADRYAEDGHVLVVHKEAEAEVCDPPDLREELGHRRTPRLERYGISAEYIGGPIAMEAKGDGTHWSFTPPDGGPIAVSFRVLHGTEDPMEAADGAAFELEVQQEGMSPVVIEPGRRRRPWTLGYGLDDGMVFVGPKGRHTAIMVTQHMTMPEGVRTTWMSSGVTLR